MRSHHIPIAGAIIAYAISGCCGDDPDLCGQSFRGMRITRLAGSAWLNALAAFEREVLPPPD